VVIIDLTSSDRTCTGFVFHRRFKTAPRQLHADVCFLKPVKPPPWLLARRGRTGWAPCSGSSPASALFCSTSSPSSCWAGPPGSVLWPRDIFECFLLPPGKISPPRKLWGGGEGRKPPCREVFGGPRITIYKSRWSAVPFGDANTVISQRFHA